MENRLRLVFVLDCADPDSLADFWASALGYRRGGLHRPYVQLVDPERRESILLLQQVPEPKSGKNRMHLDIQAVDMAAELDRLTGLGAKVLVEPHDDAGFGTAILADPEGNEFCVIVPPAGYDPYHRLGQ
jgi:predicted enzyme related to lactoylglutathione lyase